MVYENPHGYGGGYELDDEYKLIVYVKNQGGDDAPASTTRVEFKLGGGTQRVGPFPIPSGCWDPDCEFTITVDANNVVTESDETNNSANRQYIG